MNTEQAMLKVAALEKELSEVNKELAQLKQIINESPEKSYKRWRAEKNEHYYRVGDDINPLNECNDSLDNWYYSIGNYFKTKEEADEYRDKLIFNQQVIDRIAELNEGWKPDWNDYDQDKFHFFHDCAEKKTYIKKCIWIKHTSDNKHFKSEKIGETILKEFDNEKLIKWFI